MEDLLELYARRKDPSEPVVCLDERPSSFSMRSVPGQRMRPGRVAKRLRVRPPRHCQHLLRRRAPHRPAARPTPRRTRRASLRPRVEPSRPTALAGEDQPSRPRQPHTHAEKSLTEHYSLLAGKRLWRRFTVYHTPKHASWRRPRWRPASSAVNAWGSVALGTSRFLRREVAAWNRRADHACRRIDWKWRVGDARRAFRYGGIATLGAEH